jgi:hypothetical protein
LSGDIPRQFEIEADYFFEFSVAGTLFQACYEKVHTLIHGVDVGQLSYFRASPFTCQFVNCSRFAGVIGRGEHDSEVGLYFVLPTEDTMSSVY